MAEINILMKVRNALGTLVNPATEDTQLRRLGGGKKAVPFTVTQAATPFEHAPAAGKFIRLYWIVASVDPAAGVFPRITVKLPTVAEASREVYRVRGGLSHWEIFDGAVDAKLTISISADAIVDGTAHIEEL